MTVLVVGTGACEHALAARIAESSRVDRVVVMPGNAGIARDDRLVCVDAQPTLEAIERQRADLTVVAQVHASLDGLVDRLRARGRAVIGPGARAASLHGSRASAKRFLQRCGVRTPEYRACAGPDQARRAVAELGLPVVITPDGPSRGWGGTVVPSQARADAVIDALMTEHRYGADGSGVVVERALQGAEGALTLLIDETAWLCLPTVMTYPPVGEAGADRGALGAVSPHPLFDPELLERIEARIVAPVVAGVRAAGWRYRGFVRIGIVVADRQPTALELDVQLGDPDAQVLMPLIDDDPVLLLTAAASGNLGAASGPAPVRERFGCAVVALDAGAGGNRVSTDALHADSELARRSRLCFDAVAAATDTDATLVTTRGRVLTAAAVGDDAASARRLAYTRLMTAHFDGMHYRRDIGGPDIGAAIVEEGTTFLPRFHKRGGLLPVVVQDVATMHVLMLGYANYRALEATRESGYATFWSTSRGRLWTKGETSGNRLPIREIRVDCDQDAIVYLVTAPSGGACHTYRPDGSHRARCFYRRLGHKNELIHDDPD